jgi:hypothetical protein
MARVQLSDTNFGDHRIVDGTPRGGATASAQVEVTTLDDALREIPDNAVRFIKIDVQGHEMRVLHGMAETILRNPDAILMVEVSPSILPKYGSSASELVGALYGLGFAAWELQDRRVFPALAAWTYDLIRDEQWTDLILSRNERLLRSVIGSFCARDLPHGDGP